MSAWISATRCATLEQVTWLPGFSVFLAWPIWFLMFNLKSENPINERSHSHVLPLTEFVEVPTCWMQWFYSNHLLRKPVWGLELGWEVIKKERERKEEKRERVVSYKSYLKKKNTAPVCQTLSTWKRRAGWTDGAHGQRSSSFMSAFL